MGTWLCPTSRGPLRLRATSAVYPVLTDAMSGPKAPELSGAPALSHPRCAAEHRTGSPGRLLCPLPLPVPISGQRLRSDSAPCARLRAATPLPVPVAGWRLCSVPVSGRRRLRSLSLTPDVGDSIPQWSPAFLVTLTSAPGAVVAWWLWRGQSFDGAEDPMTEPWGVTGAGLRPPRVPSPCRHAFPLQ